MWWWLPRRRWTRFLAAAIATPVFVAAGMAGYYYGQFSLLVEARLQGERVRTIPRVYGRPLTLRPGLTLASDDVVQRLNDLGYTARETPREGGEFTATRDLVVVVPRGGRHAGRTVRLEWAPPEADRPASATPPIALVEKPVTAVGA